ncbi:MAG TPA: YbhN family protein [Acidimicrobiales bacterium]|nr:YbhN family protein [Acidimicrobiales bacterium]
MVLAAAALFVINRAGSSIGQVGATFDHLHWHWLFVSVAAECCSLAALSWLQQRLLRVGNLPVRVRDLLPVTAASNAVAQSLPAGLLFAEGYAFRQYQRLGAGNALGVWAELSAGSLASAALAGVAVAGAAVVGPGLRLQLLPGFAFILAGALVAAALFRRAPVLSALIRRVSRFTERHLPEAVGRHLRAAERSTAEMARFEPSWGTWGLCLAAAALNWGLDAVVLVMGLLTVGGPVPWRGVLLCYAAAQLLVELPITPGGLGIVEGGLVEVLTRFHVPVTRATAGTLMYRAVSYWFLLLVGWAAALWLTLRNRRADRAEGSPAPAATGAA